MFSNLINNSVESLENEKGTVLIELGTSRTDPNQIEIKIKDTGRGIPQELIPELGKEGKTFGKPDGNGLGLYYAIKSIKKSDGSISIQSEVGKGTEITITLPRKEAPAWFVPELNTSEVSNIVIFDDDASVHQIWKNRLESSYNKSINFHHFSSPSELKQFYRKNFSELDETTFLMDYEISNNSETGLDLIEQLGIAGSAILVTSRYEENQIRERCERLKVKIIPKNMSGFIPIQFQ
jgi:anti-sigma regulatory factor (Ser/Thr protein kinase)